MPTADLIDVTMGKWHEGILKLTSTTEMFATNDMVKAKFTELGFTQVTVTGFGSNRKAKGFWPNSSMQIERPPQIVKITEL